MPMEEHWRRLSTPQRKLTQRERGVLYSGLVITVAAILAIVAFSVGGSRPAPKPGCISVVVAGRVGGEPVSACGAEARTICARSARYDVPRSRTILAACRQQGIRTKPPSPPAARRP